MKNVLLQKAMKLAKQYRRRKQWQRFVRVIAVFVVFCTTYALILPAITMERETVCGLQAHTHTKDCYTEKPYLLMHCTLDVQPGDVVLHTHEEHCYSAKGALICQIVEKPGHTHNESCYQAPKCVCDIPEEPGHTHSSDCTTGTVLTCTVPVTEGHTHSDACAVTRQVLVCGQEESSGHTHSDSCSSEERELVCTEEHEHTDVCYSITVCPCPLEESEGHIHDESCYETQTVPCEQEETEGHAHSESCYGIGTVSCDIPETPGHTHGTECYEPQGELSCDLTECKPHEHDEHCYDSKGNIICTLPRTYIHTHDETCITDTGEKVSILTCELQEHVHVDACYAAEDSTKLEFLCDTGEHRHTEECYDDENSLICTIPEHTHDAACVVADLDMSADVETPDQWEETFKDVELTGQWPQDLVAVAQTQLEYRESRINCILSDGALKGYTRYGAKFGTPYADWDTLFVSFCLEYAAVEDFPTHADRAQWIELLEEAELYRTPDIYTPKSGDLVFLDKDQVADAPIEIPVEVDLVGIVEEIEPETEEEPAKLKVIAGNIGDQVGFVNCELADPTIIGYAELPLAAPEDEPVPTEELAERKKLEYTGADYTVTVTFGPEALLPENTVLDVREILAGTEEYDQYYQQSVAMIQGDVQPEIVEEEENSDNGLLRNIIKEAVEELTEGFTEEPAEEVQKPEVTFARFFDIHFVSEGSILEPAAPVDIHIQYHQGIDLPLEQSSVAVHFADTGIEVLDAETSRNENSHVDSFSFTQSSFSVSGTVAYAEPRAVGGYRVWLDGTCGGLKAYADAPNQSINASNPYTLPTTYNSPTTYQYRLNGWYDVTHGVYYKPGATVDITSHTVFYADWVADTYNIGEYNEYSVKTLDTNEFVTVDVFDFNPLFNTYSTKLNNSSIEDSRHSESWSHVATGNNTLNFVFVDSNGESSQKLANPSNRNNINNYTGGSAVLAGIMPKNLKATDADLKLMNALFNKNQTTIGRHYLGSGNYLFQYDSDPTSDHYGYYYYDSERNAASYYQTDGRFYVYNYLEHASSSRNKDFLPLNSPYANNPNGKGPSGDAASGYSYNTTSSYSQTTDNFFFGMKTNIHFYLPNDVGFTDNNQNPGNLDTNGNPMIFDFSGDDDVWIYVDDVLVLDIGGIHQANSGSIDFSTGVVKQGNNTTNLNSLYSDGLKEGGHDLTIYYLERGAGESNCSIYFNLAPRYGLTLKKQDYHSRENLSGVKFGVYTNEACTETYAANLWTTHTAAKADPNHENTQHIYTTDANGNIQFFGLVAGKTYYIKELEPADGYVETDDLIRVTLNNHGVDVSEVTMLGGSNGRTQGYELISHHLNDSTQEISLVLTNQKISESTAYTKHVRVTKDWVVSDQDPADLPESITVHLTKDGQHYGHSMTLGAHNGWTYTWTGLPDDGSDYDVLEDQVPGFELVQPATFSLRNAAEQAVEINWLPVGALEDSTTYLLKAGNGYLAVEKNQLKVIPIGTDDNGKLAPPPGATWSVTAAGDGFLLRNADYAITFDGSTFTVKTVGSGNQTFYYDGDGLFAMQGGSLYYLKVSGNSIGIGSSVASLTLLKREEIPVDVQHIRLTNSQLQQDQTTFLKVSKVWNTTNPIWDKEVTIHLMKNGVDSGIAMLLDRNCNWEGTFEGLPVKDAAGNNYSYSVKEAFVDGYAPEYSEVTQTQRYAWTTVLALNKNQSYVFVGTNNRVLTATSGGVTTSVLTNAANPAENQQWILDGDKLMSVAYPDQYLRYYYGSLSLFSKSNATKVSLASNYRLKLGDSNRYLVLNNDVSTSSDSNGGTSLTVYQKNTSSIIQGYQVTVTNTPVIYYNLPKTGGTGTLLYTLLGLFLAGTALTVMHNSKRKGGRYAR